MRQLVLWTSIPTKMEVSVLGVSVLYLLSAKLNSVISTIGFCFHRQKIVVKHDFQLLTLCKFAYLILKHQTTH